MIRMAIAVAAATCAGTLTFAWGLTPAEVKRSAGVFAEFQPKAPPDSFRGVRPHCRHDAGARARHAVLHLLS